MKFVIAFVALFAVAFTGVAAIAGQSACLDQSEIGQTYPHHWDPTKYWYCETYGVPATEMDCPKDLAYMHILRECIPWDSYIWKKPENPPTVA